MEPLLVFAAADLDGGGLPVDRELPAAWLAAELADVEATVDRPGRLSGRLSRSGGDEVVVRGVATAQVVLPCARCLEPAVVDLRGELSLLLKPGLVLQPPTRRVSSADADGPAQAQLRGPADRARRGAELARAGQASAGRAGRGAGRAALAASPGGEAEGGSSLGKSSLGKSSLGKSSLGKSSLGKSSLGKSSLGKSGPGGARAQGKLPEYEFSAEEADHDLYDGETVILDGFVREALLLELPNFPLCSEDCPGMPRVPAQAGSEPSLARPPAASSLATGSAGEVGERAPGTKSLGDALRAALAERDASGKRKKR